MPSLSSGVWADTTDLSTPTLWLANSRASFYFSFVCAELIPTTCCAVVSGTAFLFSLLVAVSRLLGAAVGGYLALLGIRRQQFLSDFQREHRDACEQIKAHCLLETRDSGALAHLPDQAMDRV